MPRMFLINKKKKHTHIVGKQTPTVYHTRGKYVYHLVIIIAQLSVYLQCFMWITITQ